MIDLNRIYQYKFNHPQNNLNSFPKESPEENFAKHFSQYYKDNFSKVHRTKAENNALFIREVPVSFAGIADLLVFNWKGNRSFESVISDSTIRAFEFKIDNWRSGLKQAYRYKNYSNSSILVMPLEKTKPALKYLNTFQTLKVGLWGYDFKTNKLVKHFTPRPTKANNSNSRRKLERETISTFSTTLLLS